MRTAAECVGTARVDASKKGNPLAAEFSSIAGSSWPGPIEPEDRSAFIETELIKLEICAWVHLISVSESLALAQRIKRATAASGHFASHYSWGTTVCFQPPCARKGNSRRSRQLRRRSEVFQSFFPLMTSRALLPGSTGQRWPSAVLAASRKACARPLPSFSTRLFRSSRFGAKTAS